MFFVADKNLVQQFFGPCIDQQSLKKIRRVMRRLSSRQVAGSSMSVRLSGLATGYLWTTLSVQRSLLASRVTYRNFPTSDDDNSRQNPQIRREIRKKIFRDNFFSDENLSESVQNFFLPWPESLRALGLDRYTWPVSANENRDPTKWVRQTHAQRKPPCLPSMSAETETCRVSFQSEAISIKIRWVHL